MGGILLADSISPFLISLVTFFQQSEQLEDYRDSD